MDSWLFSKNMSCNAPRTDPSLPTMALCGELAALFILKTMKYGLKVTDAVICLYCLLPCLDQTAWCELYNLLSPICHHPSSFFGNKAT